MLKEPKFLEDTPIDTFDGACQGLTGKCGIEVYLEVNVSRLFNIKMGGRCGTNTREKLLALWTLFIYKYQWHVAGGW